MIQFLFRRSKLQRLRAVNIAEVDVCHNDEEMFPDDWNTDDDVQMPDSEDEYIAGQAEGEGPKCEPRKAQGA